MSHSTTFTRKMKSIPQHLINNINKLSDEEFGRTLKEYIAANEQNTPTPPWDGFSDQALAGFAIILQDFILCKDIGIPYKFDRQ